MPPSGIGSLLTLESCLLVALSKIVSAKAIFEIGTFNGNTTLLLAANTAEDAIVTSLDLPPGDIEVIEEIKLNLQDANQNDQYLRQVFKQRGAFYLERAASRVRSKIRLIHCNSIDFDPAEENLVASQDMVFVDGGHDYATIKNDSEKALQMLRSDGIIVWHDYLSKIHTEVETYLQDLASERRIISIGSTMLCIYLQGKYADLIRQEERV